jgi:hypothetical protein
LPILAVVVFAAVALTVVGFAVFILRLSHPPLADLGHLAEFGESFALVSALFSGLAFAGLSPGAPSSSQPALRFTTTVGSTRC